MKETRYQFSAAACTIYTMASFDNLQQVVPGRVVLVTDTNVWEAHRTLLEPYTCIVIPAGEQHKQQSTIDFIIKKLVDLQADRQTFIAAVGGGVVTDMAGYAASVYMRGLPFGFIPTSILAMVDAAIGGKNGIDVGLYKNLVGTIRQPHFLLYDMALLQTLPHAEWVNGFAEIIKHACIKDAALFALLEQHNLDDFKNNPLLLNELVERNIAIKCSVVVNDEFEKGERKLLNFGHTIGHAIENILQIPHGHAVSIGMVAACTLSEEINQFPSADKQRVIALLQQYGLPVQAAFDKTVVAEMVLLDKKRKDDTIHFILLDAIGSAAIRPIGHDQFRDLLEQSF